MVAPAPERGADDFLALTERVDVGGVDEVDASVECPVHDAHARVVVGVAPGAEHHGAEAERRHIDTGTPEWSVLHRGLLLVLLVLVQWASMCGQGCGTVMPARARTER